MDDQNFVEALDTTDLEAEAEQNAESGSKSKQKRTKRRNPLVQLQQCADELSELASQDGVKSNNKVDALIRKANILTELARLTAKEKESEASAENVVLKQRHADDESTINQLRAEIDRLKATQNPVRVEVRDDPEAAEIRRSLANAGDLITNAGQVIRANVEEPTRLRISAALVKRMGKNAQPFISEICDFASIYVASLESSEALIARIDAASPGSRGAAVQVAKATLSARGSEYAGPQIGEPKHFADEFAPF